MNPRMISLSLLGAVGAACAPARATAQQANERYVTTLVSVPPVYRVGTPTPLAVTNRGKANGGIYIVYVAGTVPGSANSASCLNAALATAYPYSTDIMTRRYDGTYVTLLVGSTPVAVARHASGGNYSDGVSYRIQTKSQLSDAQATALASYLAYSTTVPCP
jgi:hypothetical protein